MWVILQYFSSRLPSVQVFERGFMGIKSWCLVYRSWWVRKKFVLNSQYPVSTSNPSPTLMYNLSRPLHLRIVLYVNEHRKFHKNRDLISILNSAWHIADTEYMLVQHNLGILWKWWCLPGKNGMLWRNHKYTTKWLAFLFWDSRGRKVLSVEICAQDLESEDIAWGHGSTPHSLVMLNKRFNFMSFISFIRIFHLSLMA